MFFNFWKESFIEKFGHVLTKNYEFHYWDKSILIALFELSDNEDFDAKIKVSEFPSGSFSKTVKPSIETLVEEIMLVVTEKYEFQYRVISIFS